VKGDGLRFDPVFGAAMQPDALADRIFDHIQIAVRKKLLEIRGRTIAELAVLFDDLRLEIADMLAETNCATGDQDHGSRLT
jgi:hypothetical protein